MNLAREDKRWWGRVGEDGEGWGRMGGSRWLFIEEVVGIPRVSGIVDGTGETKG
jgi:hypothetical protein